MCSSRMHHRCFSQELSDFFPEGYQDSYISCVQKSLALSNRVDNNFLLISLGKWCNNVHYKE